MHDVVTTRQSMVQERTRVLGGRERIASDVIEESRPRVASEELAEHADVVVSIWRRVRLVENCVGDILLPNELKAAAVARFAKAMHPFDDGVADSDGRDHRLSAQFNDDDAKAISWAPHQREQFELLACVDRLAQVVHGAKNGTVAEIRCCPNSPLTVRKTTVRGFGS